MIEFSEKWSGESAYFVEGAILAANLSPVPLSPDTWLPLLHSQSDVEQDSILSDSERADVMRYFEQQFNILMRHEYQIPSDIDLKDRTSESREAFSRGFLAVWQQIEAYWQDATMIDGTRRMLSALITSILCIYDEEGTLEEMREAGFNPLPCPDTLFDQFALMANEVALAANENVMKIKQGSVINPYKSVGRNDSCLCGSGKKYKKCCGK